MRILVLFDTDMDPPAGQDYTHELESSEEAEFDVARALKGLGHEVRLLGFRNDLDALVAGLRAEPVDAVFNLTERFRNLSTLDYGVAAVLEMLGMPYTGASAAGLMLSRNKALTKMVLVYQGLRIPHFFVCQRGLATQRPSDVRFPLIVKPLDEDASVGIAQRSVVHDDASLTERVSFIHTRLDTAAIIEEFIVGRELYVGVIGNERLQVFPVWELLFERLPEGAPRIATERVKWSRAYQEKVGVKTAAAKNLPDELLARIARLCKRIYRTLQLSGYARIDLRLDGEGRVYVLEANPNPQIAYGEDFAESAEYAGIKYGELLQRIVNLGMRWSPETRG